MGWTCIHKPHNVKDYLVSTINHQWDNGDTATVLEIKIKNFRTAYLAIELIQNKTRRVVGGVVLLDYHNGELCYKDIGEDGGPYRCECPESILNRLTETENKYALQWREKCRENLERVKKRPTMKKGTYLYSEKGLLYAGKRCHRFQVTNRSQAMSLDGGFLCQFPRRQLDHCVVVNSFDELEKSA